MAALFETIRRAVTMGNSGPVEAPPSTRVVPGAAVGAPRTSWTPITPPGARLLSAQQVIAARTAIAVVFAAAGLAFSSLASRFPAVRADLQLTPAGLGTTLLAMSLGAVAALPLSSPLVHRFGPGRTVALGFGSVVAGLLVIGAGDTRLWLAAGFTCMGIGSGVSDVAMNVEAADVERRLGRDVMSRFHAGFSVGTVGGAALGAGMAELGVPYRLHLAVVAVVVGATVAICLPHFVHGFAGRPDAGPRPVTASAEPALAAPALDGSLDGSALDHSALDASAATPPRRHRGQLAAWTERRTLLIGVLVLGMAFAEGSANDWISLALVDDYGVGHAMAALGFGVFVTAMTVGRLSGPWVLARLGRVTALRGGALLVLVGSSLLAWGAQLGGPGTTVALALALTGALLWGAGAALGFPVGMSAAADEPHAAAARVGVASTIGYTAFIAGPPLLGHLGDHVGVAHALVGVTVAVLLSLVAAPAAAPPRTVNG